MGKCICKVLIFIWNRISNIDYTEFVENKYSTNRIELAPTRIGSGRITYAESGRRDFLGPPGSAL
jgi:hypothetical protein